MRIASLVPSSTEMLFELGLGDQVVAVTHECDWPPEAESLPKLTSSVIPDGLAAGEIDRVVRETVGRGEPLYLLDRDRLAELDPELIVTQAVCEVCAVSYDDVVAVAATLPSHPRVVSLDAAAYFSRPGPRLVTGVELLAHILHPDLFARPDGAELVECGRRDSNPHGQSPPAPKAGASTSSAT